MIDQFQIDTPENISFRYDIAGIGSRFLANLVDALIQGFVYAGLLFSAAILFNLFSGTRLPNQISNLITAGILLVIFLVQFGYFILFEIALNGQTPGKRLVGLRVIKENGYPLGALDSIIRNIVRIIDFFPFAYGIGLIVMFLNPRAKRLGDFAAGTIVVRVRDQVQLSDLQKIDVAPASLHPVELPGIDNLREADIEMIESFLMRRSQLRNSDELAQTLSQSIVGRLNTPEAQALATASTENFFRAVIAAYRRPKTNQGA
jgi:uncharacterized RDD family membrane protein YckC